MPSRWLQRRWKKHRMLGRLWPQVSLASLSPSPRQYADGIGLCQSRHRSSSHNRLRIPAERRLANRHRCSPISWSQGKSPICYVGHPCCGLGTLSGSGCRQVVLHVRECRMSLIHCTLNKVPLSAIMMCGIHPVPRVSSGASSASVSISMTRSMSQTKGFTTPNNRKLRSQACKRALPPPADG